MTRSRVCRDGRSIVMAGLLVVPTLICAVGPANFAAADNPAAFESDRPNTPAVMATATQPGPASNGVHAVTNSDPDSAVYGEHSGNGIGVFGRGGPNRGEGVFGQTNSASSGVYGKNATGGAGTTGESQSGVGVVGISASGFGVSGTAAAAGVYAHNTQLGHDAYLAAGCCAGDFYGDVFVHAKTTTQVLEITGGGDLAESFQIAREGSIQPGMVVAIDPMHPGQLRLADHSYDRTVAGIIAGANGLNPGLILTSDPTSTEQSQPVALTGRVYAWADATHNPIQPGDLLTTADTPGHAMKVTDFTHAQGAVLGKAMSGLPQGKGLVLVLVSLQ